MFMYFHRTFKAKKIAHTILNSNYLYNLTNIFTVVEPACHFFHILDNIPGHP